ncbi:LTA synthase family protein [Desulfocicer vacuolatum]|nr:LTA synthase family protein [Desulfocicer vacuolatum]
MICYLISIPVLLAPLLNGFKKTHTLWRTFAGLWFSCSLLFLFFMEVVTPFFIVEYDTRPNRLFVEYLAYPKEVMTMLVTGYKAELIFSAVAVTGALFFARRVYPEMTKRQSFWDIIPRFMALPIVFVIIFAGARSSLGHRPANPSTVAFSSDHLLNSLPLSSGYNLIYAIYRMGDEADASKIYGEMDVNRMLELVRKNATGNIKNFTNKEIPTLHSLSPGIKRPSPLNLLILLEESLGAEFVGRMGGLPLTPNLDELSREGLFFNRLYATGTRSVRGIEAVVSGFFPTPGRSVVKLGKAQNNFFSLASFLKTKGYKTRFVYGGEANFDNMKGFFLGNGFDEVIEEKDFHDYTFKGSWGVCDEDLLTKAHELLEDEKSSPSFTLVFSSSNHSPFEFPDNAIELYESPKATVNNAVKYADHAIGRFFDMAKKSNYWNQTLFLVVADHNSRVYGDALVPIERFHIPALIIGPGVAPGISNTLASQVDLPPTLLSLMGLEGQTPMLGRNLLNMPKGVVGRAVMQFYKNQAYMEGEHVLVLQPGKNHSQFHYDGKRLTKEKITPFLLEKALAHAQWASWSYSNRLYKLPSMEISASSILMKR